MTTSIPLVISGTTPTCPPGYDPSKWHPVDLAAALKLPKNITLPFPATIMCWCLDGKHKMVRDSFRVDL